MRVLVVTAHWPPRLSGHGDFAAKLAQSLANAGNDVSALVLGQADLVEEDLVDIDGVSVGSAPFPSSFRNLRKIASAVEAAQPDIVCLQFEAHAFGLHAIPHLLPLYLRAKGHAVVMTYHELWSPKRFGRLAKVALLNAAHDVVVFSEWHAQGVARFRRFGSRAVEIAVGTNIEAPAADRNLLRARYGVPIDQKIVTFFGFVMSSHLIQELLGAIAALPAQPEVHLQVIGKFDPAVDGYNQQLIAQAKALGIADRVTWHGRIEDATAVARLLRMSDVGVLPYDTGVGENNGAFAAMAAQGLPIVTTAGERSKNMEAAEVALFCEPNAASLAAGLRKSIDDVEGSALTAKRASAWSELRSWSVVAGQYGEVFEQRLRAKGGQR